MEACEGVGGFGELEEELLRCGEDGGEGESGKAGAYLWGVEWQVGVECPLAICPGKVARAPCGVAHEERRFLVWGVSACACGTRGELADVERTDCHAIPCEYALELVPHAGHGLAEPIARGRCEQAERNVWELAWAKPSSVRIAEKHDARYPPLKP